MRAFIYPLILLFFLTVVAGCTGCASSQPIDVELAEQGRENALATNAAMTELVDLLDQAKGETPDADWTEDWSEGRRESYLLQARANEAIAEKILERAKDANKGD